MIYIYSGIPGSGKTFCATSDAVKALKRGRPVFSNYPIRYKDRVSYKLEKSDIKKGVFPEGSLIVIDEAGSWFNSRDWKSFTMEDFILFTQHRHMGYDLIMCAQHPARIDTVVREIANVFVWWRNYWIFFLGTGYYEYTDIGTRDREVPTRSFIRFKRRRVMMAYDTHYYRYLLENRENVPFEEWEVSEYKEFKDRIKEKLSSVFKVKHRVVVKEGKE